MKTRTPTSASSLSAPRDSGREEGAEGIGGKNAEERGPQEHAGDDLADHRRLTQAFEEPAQETRRHHDHQHLQDQARQRARAVARQIAEHPIGEVAFGRAVGERRARRRVDGELPLESLTDPQHDEDQENRCEDDRGVEGGGSTHQEECGRSTLSVGTRSSRVAGHSSPRDCHAADFPSFCGFCPRRSRVGGASALGERCLARRGQLRSR